MMTDAEYEREIQWAARQIRDAGNCSDLCSPVGMANMVPQHTGIYVLRVRGNDLILKGKKKTYFRVPLEQVTAMKWERSGIFIKLDIKVRERKCHLQFEALSSFHPFRSRNLNNLFLSFFFRRSRLATQMRSIAKANFTEAEKWRDIFPDAPFPDTQIPNAKS